MWIRFCDRVMLADRSVMHAIFRFIEAGMCSPALPAVSSLDVISAHSVIVPSTLLMHAVWCVCVSSIQYLLQLRLPPYTADVLCSKCSENSERGFVNWFRVCLSRRLCMPKSDARLQLPVLCGITCIQCTLLQC